MILFLLKKKKNKQTNKHKYGNFVAIETKGVATLST